MRPFLVMVSMIFFTVGHPEDAASASRNDPEFATLEIIASDVFEEEGAEGAFLLYDEARDEFLRFNPELTTTRLAPASTFKILNSLIFLQEQAVSSVDDPIEWDGVEREFGVWNRDQTLRSAYRYSTVWAFQQIARQIGLARLKDYLSLVGYGNGKTGEAADEFWLDDSLRISPEEQILFLRRLATGDLPFSSSVMDAVKSIMIAEETSEYILRGKTGLALRTDPQRGWYVGYLEAADNTYFFALTTIVEADGRGRNRVEMASKILMRYIGLRDCKNTICSP